MGCGKGNGAGERGHERTPASAHLSSPAFGSKGVVRLNELAGRGE